LTPRSCSAIRSSLRDRYPSVIIPQRIKTQLAAWAPFSPCPATTRFPPLSGMNWCWFRREDRRRSKILKLRAVSKSEIFPGRDGTGFRPPICFLDPENRATNPASPSEANYLSRPSAPPQLPPSATKVSCSRERFYPSASLARAASLARTSLPFFPLVAGVSTSSHLRAATRLLLR